MKYIRSITVGLIAVLVTFAVVSVLLTGGRGGVNQRAMLTLLVGPFWPIAAGVFLGGFVFRLWIEDRTDPNDDGYLVPGTRLDSVDTLGIGPAPRAIEDKAATIRYLAFWAYVLSFGLVAVSRDGSVSIQGALCAYFSLMELVSPIVDSRFFETKAAVYIPALLSGSINIVFLATLAMRWWEGNRRPFKILRTITLLMIPSCWIVFSNEHLYPREGHVLWVVAMVLALFS